MNVNTHADKKRIGYIDSIRGIAILMVIFFHVGLITDLKGIPGLLSGFGNYGVQLFFIVSGYTIYSSLHSSTGQRNNVRRFYVKRLVRIYPMYWFGILLYTLIYGLESHWLLAGPEVWHFPGHALLLNSFIPGGTSSVVPGGWSISVEVCFYLLAPALFLLSRRLLTLIITWSAVFVVGLSLTNFLPQVLPLPQLDESSQARFWYRFILNQLPIFGLGFLLFSILNRPTFESRLTSVLGVLALVAGLIVSTYQAYYLVAPIPRHLSMSIFFVFLWLALFCCRETFLNNSILRFWGKLSYSAYLLHFVCVRTVFEILGEPTDFLGTILVLAFGLCLTAVLSSVLYRFLEVRLMEIGHRLTTSK